MNVNQIAAQLYTVRDYCKTAEDLERTLAKIKKIGYSSVQVSGIGPIHPTKVKELTDLHGLSICATHMPYDRLLQDIDAVIEEHRLWNCKYVGLGSIPEKYRGTQEGYLALAKEFKEIASKLAAADMQFVYHNHHFEFEKYSGTTGLEILLQATAPSFGFELDVYWAQAGGANPVDWIHKLNGRMQVIHFKDMAIVDGKAVFAEIGEGNLNWPSILQACRDIGMEWYIVEQDTCMRDPFESLAISYNYLMGRVV